LGYSTLTINHCLPFDFHYRYACEPPAGVRAYRHKLVDWEAGALHCQPIEVSFMRWSNSNPDKRWQLQRFGGALSDFRGVDGFRLPFRVDAGNFWGTDAYFAFYKAEVEAMRFPRP
jgi:hypothetical protein